MVQAVRASLTDRFGRLQQLTSSSLISMPRVIRVNVSPLSERAWIAAADPFLRNYSNSVARYCSGISWLLT
jgi:hypothetical protein